MITECHYSNSNLSVISLFLKESLFYFFEGDEKFKLLNLIHPKHVISSVVLLNYIYKINLIKFMCAASAPFTDPSMCKRLKSTTSLKCVKMSQGRIYGDQNLYLSQDWNYCKIVQEIKTLKKLILEFQSPEQFWNDNLFLEIEWNSISRKTD